MVVELFSLSNAVFSSYVFYGSIVLLKLLAMGPLTSFRRLTRKVFSNPEDLKGMGGKKLIFDDNVVERVRRNHQNDVENIPVFILIGLFYVAIQPTVNAAAWHFRIFAFSRILHTIAYQLPLPQPSRALTYAVGVAVTVSMGLQVLLSAQ